MNAAAAEDPSPQFWGQAQSDARYEHGAFAPQFSRSGDTLISPRWSSVRSGAHQGAASQHSPVAVTKEPIGTDQVPEDEAKAGSHCEDAPPVWEPQQVSPSERTRRVTPAAILRDCLDNRDEPLPDDKFNETVARLFSFPDHRLPVMLSKLLIAEDERLAGSRQSILDAVYNSGTRRSDLEHWLSILKAPTSEEMVELFISPGTRQPSLLLNHILRPTAVFTERATLESIVRYLATWYAEGRSISSGDDIDALRIPIRRLAFHCCRSWPDLLASVAQVVASHIQTGVPNTLPAPRVYRAQITAYNTYLQIFASAPDRHGRQYMNFVWEAQRILLGMSSELQKPLLLEKKSLTAIRLVLLGLQKTEEERDTASRWSRTWPPYKVVRNGLDEQKDPEDDYTRPIKAGVTMQVSGYSREPIDDVIDTLAGMAPDGSPTIQTRANLPKLLKRGHKVGAEEVWASKVRATRNAHEAWLVFQQRPPGTPRGSKVYGEMFRKLTEELSLSDHYQAGDGRYAVEVHIPNLSDFEKARRQPPTVAQLYEHMLEEGIKPEGYCLTVLLESTTRPVHFHRYARDSTLHPDVVEWLAEPTDRGVRDLFRRLPFGVIQAYVRLLCCRHPIAAANKPDPDSGHNIQNALSMVLRYAAAAKMQNLGYLNIRPLWTALLERLSRPTGVWFRALGAEESIFETLLLYLVVLCRAMRHCVVDRDIFFYTAKALRNTIASEYGKSMRKTTLVRGERAREKKAWAEVQKLRKTAAEAESPVDISKLRASYKAGEIDRLNVLVSTSEFLTSTFRRMTERVPHLVGLDGIEYPMPADYHELRGMEAHMYMQVLGYLGDRASMVRLLGWIAEQWIRDPREKNRFHLKKAMACFRALGEPETLEVVRGVEVSGDGAPDDRWAVREDVEEGKCDEAEGEGEEANESAEESEEVEQEEDEGVSEEQTEKIREKLRILEAWPDDEEVQAYLETTHAANDMFQMLRRLENLA